MCPASAYSRSSPLRHGGRLALACCALVALTSCARIDIPLSGLAHSTAAASGKEAPKLAQESVTASPLAYGAAGLARPEIFRLGPVITDALVRTNVGQTAYWQSTEMGLAGTVTPEPGVMLGPVACRPFKATAFAPNVPERTLQLSGEACRSQGRWSLTRLSQIDDVSEHAAAD